MYESIFDNATNVEPIEAIEVLDTDTPVVNEVKPEPKVEMVKEKDKIFTLQIILILAWVILTTLVYFFGYPLFEPFINV